MIKPLKALDRIQTSTEKAGLTAETKLAVNEMVTALKSAGIRFAKSDVLVHSSFIVRLSTKGDQHHYMPEAIRAIQKLGYHTTISDNLKQSATPCRYWSVELNSELRPGTKENLTFVTMDEMYGTVYLQF